MKKICRYETDVEIPEGAVYLSTQVEKSIDVSKFPEDSHEQLREWIVAAWHYFLVEVDAPEEV